MLPPPLNLWLDLYLKAMPFPFGIRWSPETLSTRCWYSSLEARVQIDLILCDWVMPNLFFLVLSMIVVLTRGDLVHWNCSFFYNIVINIANHIMVTANCSDSLRRTEPANSDLMDFADAAITRDLGPHRLYYAVSSMLNIVEYFRIGLFTLSCNTIFFKGENSMLDPSCWWLL